MNEFKRAAALELEDRQSVAVEQIQRTFDFLQYAPLQFNVLARIRLARLHRGTHT